MRNGPYEMVVAPENYPGFRYRNRYIYEHHLVWWIHTKTLVSDGHVIHHINGVKRDNRIENLELQHRGEHTREHLLKRPLKTGPVHRTTLMRRKKKLLVGITIGSEIGCYPVI